jgi:hypothetical protein
MIVPERLQAAQSIEQGKKKSTNVVMNTDVTLAGSIFGSTFSASDIAPSLDKRASRKLGRQCGS